MAFTQSLLTRNVSGNLRTYCGSFTSAAGDNTLTVTHGLYYVVDDRVTLDGSVGWQVPKVTHSAGVATIVWDDTQGGSGTFCFTGR